MFNSYHVCNGWNVGFSAWVVWMEQWGRFWRKVGLMLGDNWTQKHERCWDGFGSHQQWEKCGSHGISLQIGRSDSNFLWTIYLYDVQLALYLFLQIFQTKVLSQIMHSTNSNGLQK